MIVSKHFFTVSPIMRNGSRELLKETVKIALGHAISMLANSLDWQIREEPTFRFRELPLSELPDDGEVEIVLLADNRRHPRDIWTYRYQVFPKNETLCGIPICEGCTTVKFSPCLIPAG